MLCLTEVLVKIARAEFDLSLEKLVRGLQMRAKHMGLKKESSTHKNHASTAAEGRGWSKLVIKHASALMLALHGRTPEAGRRQLKEAETQNLSASRQDISVGKGKNDLGCKGRLDMLRCC